jgi:hypothetical protein
MSETGETVYANDEYNDGGDSEDDRQVTWAAFREDIRDTYEPGETISGPSQIIEDIDRVDATLYAGKGLEALANRGVLGDEGDQYRVLKPS